MSRIRIMPDALASQVAAGEVVERPAAVVRELIENSLDAGATQIEVHVQRGGAALIKVTDNGGGMDREDALLCIERHATSKIRTKEDLSAIRTLGFRGEALPSIASVSHFRLATREPAALSGTEIEINGGRMHAVRDHGGAPGTMVEARGLFYNVPARRKFLRSEPTEFAHVEQQFRTHAIAYPHVAFTLVRDGGVLFHLPATTDRRERIEGFVGRDLARQLLRVEDEERGGVSVGGFVGGAALSRPNRQLQLVFLNGRPVESPAVNYALREGYHTALMKGQHPVTFLFLDMMPNTFDINVHPAKKEVRFHNSNAVRDAVSLAVRRTLENSAAIPTGHASFARSNIPARSAFVHQTPSFFSADHPSRIIPDATGAPFFPQVNPEAPAPAPAGNVISHDTPTAGNDDAVTASFVPAPSSSAEARASDFRIIGVLGKLYVLMESQDGLVLMDQHAAHERVLFEQLRRALEHEGVPAQRLLLPVTLEVPPRDFDFLMQNLPVLQRLGIEAGPFGNNVLKIDSLPSFLKTDDPQALLRAVLDELAGAGSRTSALRLGEDMIATTVCRHAVKANDTLRGPELQKLLADLLACEMPWCCPHGRPTLIQISHAELERKFGRRAP